MADILHIFYVLILVPTMRVQIVPIVLQLSVALISRNQL